MADLWEVPAADDGFSVPKDIELARIDPGQYFKRTDLAQMARDGIPPATMICSKLLYEAGLHSVSGSPDCGKSTFICWCALQVIRSGENFILMDEESGPQQYAEKFVALGATADELERLYYYGFPGVNWNLPEILGLVNLVEDVQPQVIAWDSSAAFLARAGMDEDRAPDVTRFWSQVLTPCARDQGAAVLVADHDTKSGIASRFARGSGAKLAATDVQYKMEVITPFSRAQAGDLRLNVTKDRRGQLHRFHEVAVIPDQSNGSLEFRVTETTPELPPTARPLTIAVYNALTQEPASRQAIGNKVALATHMNHARESIQRALGDLEDQGLAVGYPTGIGRDKYWSRGLPMTPEAPVPVIEPVTSQVPPAEISGFDWRDQE